MNRITIFTFIPSLGFGGAEQGLLSYLSNSNRVQFTNVIVSLYKGGFFEEPIRTLGYRVEIINMKNKFDLLGYFRIIKLIGKYDRKKSVISGHLFDGNFIALIINIILNIPIISTIHNAYEWDKNLNQSSSIKLLLKKIILNRIINTSKAICVVSERILPLINCSNNPKAIILPCSIDPSRFEINRLQVRKNIRYSLNIPNNAFLLISVGRLIPIKAHYLQIEALEDLCNSYPDIYLIIIGDGGEMDTLNNLVIEKKLTGRVFIPGSKFDVENYLAASDLYINSSISEGTSVSILEAMISFLPIIASKVGGNPELLQNEQNGKLVQPLLSREIAQAVEYYYLHRDQLIQAGIHAHEFVINNYSNSTYTTTIENIIFKVVNETRDSLS